MTEREIEHLRRKFTIASTLAFFLVMLVMGGVIYIFTSTASYNEAMQVIDYIIENDGDMPQADFDDDGKPIPETETQAETSQSADETETSQSAEETETADGTAASESEQITDAGSASAEASSSAETASSAENGTGTQTAQPTTLSPEASSIAEKKYHHSMFQSLSDFFGTGNIFSRDANVDELTHYFAVLYDADGNLVTVKNSFTESLNEEEAEYYAVSAMNKHRKSGSYGGFYYKVAERADGGTIVVYVDYSGQLSTTMRIYYAVIALILLGTIIVFLIMRGISFRIVQPEVENVERQKQFITNASHELKTPLAVIRANTEMQEMLDGSSEWTQSTLRQVTRMDGLIRNLVLIARSQENEKGGDFLWIDVSGPVRETAESFQSVAASESKQLEIHVEDGIELLTDDSLIRQLTSLLTDNAVKYCDDGGVITVALTRQGKYVHLAISNTYAEGATVDYSRFFDRFYREDDAHSTDKGGYGIGLSVAESIVHQMRGKIDASWKDGVITFTCRIPGKTKESRKNSGKTAGNPE